MVKILLMKHGTLNEYLIGKVTELDEEPSILVEGCYKIVDGKLEIYPRYSSQRDLFLTSDAVFTIVDPSTERLCLLDRGLPDNLPLVSALAELFSFQELLSVDPLLERSLKNLDRERFSSLKIKWDSIL